MRAPIDNETFDGEKYSVDVSKLKNMICSQCDYVIDYAKREATCANCGRGFMFRVDQVDYINGRLVDKRNNRTV